MEFDLSKPQKLLQQSARDWFAHQCPAKRVRELMATDSALTPKSGPPSRIKAGRASI